MSEETQSVDSAIDSAFDAEQQSDATEPEQTDSGTDVQETPEGSDTPEDSTPASEETSPEPEDENDALLKLTPEELEQIKSNPATAKLYKSVMRSATQKWQEIAEYKKLWDALNNDPEKAIAALAATQGLRITKDGQEPATGQKDQAEKVADELSEEWSKVVGADAAQLLRPLIEKTAQAAISGQMGPMQQATQALQQDARNRQAQAQVAQFKAHAEKNGWNITPEVEAKMTQLGQQLRPAKDIETVEEGVEHLVNLYKLATADDALTNAEKRVLERMQKAAQTAEPARGVSSVGRGEKQLIPDGTPFNEALDIAFDSETPNLRL